MKTVFETQSHTILLEGNVEHPTAEDMERVQRIRDELKAKHHEGGIIAHRSSKASGYKRLTIEWRSKPKLEEGS